MIPVLIDETTGVDRKQDLILGGVPVTRGAIPAGGWFMLKGKDGGEFMVEGNPAAYWDDGSAKWLHLCGLVDLIGGKQNRFTLTAAKSSPKKPLRVDSDDHTVKIRGGLLDVDICADAKDLLSVSRPGAKPQPLIKEPGLSGTLVYVGPDGQNRRTHKLSLEGARAEVVVQTANRVVVRLGGTFPGSDGRAVSELILFLEVYRQIPEIRIEPVWIYLGKPREDLVESLLLTVHAPLAPDECSYGFSEERGEGYWDVIQRIKNDRRGGDGPRFPIARQLQLGSSFYKTEKLTFKQDASWLKAVEGQRSQGWCHIADKQLGITAAMRYFWEEYPHSLAMDCDDGTITFGLVPPGANPLDLRRYSPIGYGAAVYESGGRHQFRSEFHGAYGIAKAHELMLRFHEPGDKKDVAARALFFTRPIRLMTEPGHFAGTNVIGRIAAPTPAKDKNVEATITKITDFLIAEREVRGWYGLMNFGDVMSSYYSDLDQWAFDDGGYAWVNTESLPDYGLWISALRTARSDWLEAAIEMSRHNRDVDVYHRGELKGTGSRHNVNHWGGPDKEWRISMPLVRRLHYYVTGDPWTAEYIRNTVSVYQSYERTKAASPGMTGALAGILVKWEMSCDAKDRKVLENLADLYALAVRKEGQFITRIHANLGTGEGHAVGDEPDTKTFFMNTFGGQHVLVELAELLDHKKLSDALVRHAGYWLTADAKNAYPRKKYAGIRTLAFLAHAYRCTGEERFREAIRKALDTHKFELTERGGEEILDKPRHLIMPGLTRRNKVTCHGLGDVMHLCPYGLAEDTRRR
jgi:hypothetical protein